jgi:hypothetical protein
MAFRVTFRAHKIHVVSAEYRLIDPNQQKSETFSSNGATIFCMYRADQGQ